MNDHCLSPIDCAMQKMISENGVEWLEGEDYLCKYAATRISAERDLPGTLGTLQDLRQVPELETDDIMQRKDANIDEVLTCETPPSFCVKSRTCCSHTLQLSVTDPFMATFCLCSGDDCLLGMQQDRKAADGCDYWQGFAIPSHHYLDAFTQIWLGG